MPLTQEEFRHLYDQQQPPLTRQLQRQYRALADEVEDVVQDTFAKLWRHFGRHDAALPGQRPAPHDACGWLFRTANNAMIDRTRMHKRRRTTDIHEIETAATGGDREALDDARVATGTNPEGAMLTDGDDGTTHDTIGAALDVMQSVMPALKERDRVILTLKYIDGLAYPEIAQRLGLSPAAIGTTLLRARRAALSLFEEEIARQRAEQLETRPRIS